MVTQTNKPFFDNEFRRLVDVMAFHTVQKIVCVPILCGPAFAQKVMELAPALVRCAPDGSPDLQELEAFAARFDQFDLFWHLVSEAKDLLLLQEVRMLGFGAFGRREPSGSVKALLSNPMAKAAALLSNRQPSLPSPIRPRSDPLQGPAVLRDAELLAKDKWIACGWSGSPWRQVRMLRSRTILADPLSCRRMSQHCSASLP